MKAEHYAATGDIRRHRLPSSLLAHPSVIKQLVKEGYKFIALFTNGASGDVCLSSSPEYFFRGSVHDGKLIQHSYDRQYLSACHLFRGWSERVVYFHVDIDTPFLIGDNALNKHEKSPLELLNGALKVNIPWNAVFFGGFARDCQAAVDPGQSPYDKGTTIGSLKREWDSAWNGLAITCKATCPHVTVGVLGIGSRGLYAPVDPARAAVSRQNKRYVFVFLITECCSHK